MLDNEQHATAHSGVEAPATPGNTQPGGAHSGDEAGATSQARTQTPRKAGRSTGRGRSASGRNSRPGSSARSASSPGEESEDDALALLVLSRLQEQAWSRGEARRSLGKRMTTEDGVAPWDARRTRGGGACGGAGSEGLDADSDDDFAPGIPTGRDRPGPTRFDPRTGKRELDRAVTQRGWAGKLAMAHVVNSWGEIAGPQLAEHSQIIAFDEGSLTVRASSSAWAQQLRLLQPTIERNVGEVLQKHFLGAGSAQFSLKILGPAGPSWKHGRFGAARGGRGPRDTYG